MGSLRTWGAVLLLTFTGAACGLSLSAPSVVVDADAGQPVEDAAAAPAIDAAGTQDAGDPLSDAAIFGNGHSGDASFTVNAQADAGFIRVSGAGEVLRASDKIVVLSIPVDGDSLAPLVTGESILLVHSSLAGTWDGGALPLGTLGQVVETRIQSTLTLVDGLQIETTDALPTINEPGWQVVHVPEYENLTVENGVSLRATPWDGKSGGIVAMRVRGTLDLAGDITATAAGFRRGLQDGAGRPAGCVNGNPMDSAPSGEGAFAASYEAVPVVGSRPAPAFPPTNGGLGGRCADSGGGGGGNASAGGRGGNTFGQMPTSGAPGGGGGIALSAPPAGRRLLFGGGGGSGEIDSNPTADNSDYARGGRGGGALFLRAAILKGGGKLRASGQIGMSSLPKLGVGDGAGGAGAGGAIDLSVGTVSVCPSSIEASGGRGGFTSPDHGPGGGGGAGWIYLRGPIPCPATAGPGLAGGLDNMPNQSRGAQPGESPLSNILR